MSDFDRQFAIRLPDGSMFLVPEPAPNPLLAAQHNLDCPTGPRTDEEETAAMLALIEAGNDYISALGALRAAIPT